MFVESEALFVVGTHPAIGGGVDFADCAREEKKRVQWLRFTALL